MDLPRDVKRPELLSRRRFPTVGTMTIAKFLGCWLVVLLAQPVPAADTAPAPIPMSAPLDYQVCQRATASTGQITIAGSLSVPADRLEARLVGTSASGELPGTWHPLPHDSRVPAFRGSISGPAGGWYRLEIRATRAGVVVAAATVEHVALGEVFVIAGQSNSANYGEERNNTTTGRVAAWDGKTWRLANDPIPGASGEGGSFMPRFGDTLASHLHVPIGLVAMGIGATSVREWLPAGIRFTNPPTIVHQVVTVGPGEWEALGRIYANFAARMKALGPAGFRAVLWHQGESDAHQAAADRTLSGNDYRQQLEKLIAAFRQDIGWSAPWFVAQVSYHVPSDTGDPAIRAAQKAVWDDGFALPGPDTDTLTGDRRDGHGQGVHLSGLGLREHAQLWADKVLPWLDRQMTSAAPATTATPAR